MSLTAEEERERLRDYVSRLPIEKRKSEFVYFALSMETNRIKIGIAANPWERIAALQTACPEEIRLLAYIHAPAALDKERELHARFRDYHVRGEWFECVGDIVECATTEGSQDWEWLEIRVGPPPVAEDGSAPVSEWRPEDKRPRIPDGVEAPRGNARKARMARYLLARGLER